MMYRVGSLGTDTPLGYGAFIQEYKESGSCNGGLFSRDRTPQSSIEGTR